MVVVILWLAVNTALPLLMVIHAVHEWQNRYMKRLKRVKDRIPDGQTEKAIVIIDKDPYLGELYSLELSCRG